MSIALNKKSVTAINFHVFSDASIAAVIYVVGHQASITYQDLVISKSRVSKKNLTIPRLELVSSHMGFI